MTRRSSVFSAIALSFSILLAGSGSATAQTGEPVYGRQLMTKQEMRQYRQKMRAATSDEERKQLRLQHRQEMQERAKKKGITLPDEPPGQGMGPGRGMGPGQGMRPGQAMGPGQGGGPGAGR